MLGDAGELRGLLEGAGFRRVEIRPAALTVHLPSPERFVQLTVLSSAAVLPVFAQMDAATRAALAESVRREIDPLLRPYCENGTLASPTATQFALAEA